MSDTNNNIITLAEIGSQFHEARVHRGVLIEDVAKTLKISSKILRAIEAGNREDLPQLVFLRGFLKSYGLFLGFPETDLQKALTYLEESEPKTTFTPSVSEQKPFFMGEATIAHNEDRKKKIVRGFSVVVVAIAVVILSLYMFSNNLTTDSFISENETTQTEEVAANTGNVEQDEIIVVEEGTALEEIAVADNANEVAVPEISSEVEAGASNNELIEPTAQEEAAPAQTQETALASNDVEELTTPTENEEIFELPVKFQRIGFFGGGKQTLVVQAIEDCWLSFTLDPSLLAEGEKGQREAFLRRGQEMLLSYEKDVTLRLGNAGGVIFVKNGVNIGAPGRSGQVRTVTHTATN